MNGIRLSGLLALLTCLVLGLNGTNAQSGVKLEPKLAQKIRAQPNALFDVVIRFDRVAPPIGTPRAEVIKYLRGDLGRELTIINAVISPYGIRLAPDANESLWLDSSVAVRLPGQAIEVISAVAGGVDVVFENFKVRIPKVMAQSTASEPAGTPWHLSAIGANTTRDAGLRGAGVRVGHLDTGVDPNHPELAGKIAAFAEFNASGDRVPNAQARDTTGHGTHTAGLIVGSKVGVAPDAKILSALVLPGGEGTFAQVIAGMQWVLDPDNNAATDDGAKIVSMSLGLPGQFDAFIPAVRNMVRAGALPVFAAGNSGPAAGSINSPGNLPEPLTVGAVDQSNALASFSSRGPVTWGAPINASFSKPDVVAPGVGITSLAPGGSYAALSGTSQAAPIVAGAAAVLRAAKPGASWDAIKNALRDGARGLGGDQNAIGRGLVSLPGALEKLGVAIEAAKPPPAPPAPQPQPAPPPASPTPPPAAPTPPPSSPPATSGAIIREIVDAPADGVLRGVIDPGPKVIVGQPIQSIEIRLIDASGNVAYAQKESNDPYCFAGDKDGKCGAFDTRKIPDGRYALSLKVTMPDGKVQEFRGSVQIANGGQAATSTKLERPPGLLFKPGALENASSLPDTNAFENETSGLFSTGSKARFRLPGNVKNGRYEVSVRARGQAYKGAPELELRVNGKAVGRLTVDGAGYALKSFGVFKIKAGDLLEVVFTNDAYEGSADKDRNAFLDILNLQPR
jgi:subtilisin family serine protease